jgi:endonuclease V-like protein UPF0215 family
MGIDDCPFDAAREERTTVLGVIFRGGLWLDGATSTDVEIDGKDSTKRLVEMIKSSPHYKQLRVIMMDTITLAGFNIVDILRLNQEIGFPVIAVTRDKPNNDDVKAALRNLPDWEDRWSMIRNAGDLNEIHVRNTTIFAHVAGISTNDAEAIVKISSTRANYPEPLRVAHLLAHSLYARAHQ